MQAVSADDVSIKISSRAFSPRPTPTKPVSLFRVLGQHDAGLRVTKIGLLPPLLKLLFGLILRMRSVFNLIDTTHHSTSMADRPPSPGDDATPFLLRVYVKPAPFRPLEDFHSDPRSARDEFKLYVWKTNTLRDVAQMLHDADPSISSPLALHAFRHICYNERRRDFEATPIGVGITRVPLDSVTDLLADLDTADKDQMDTDTPDHSASPKRENGSTSTATILGWDTLKEEIDESAAAMTLAQIKLNDGDFLDCVVKPDPTLALTPKPSRTVGRDRPPPPDRFAHSRR